MQESWWCIGEDDAGYMRFPLLIRDGESCVYYTNAPRSVLYTLVYDLYCVGILLSPTGTYSDLRDAFLTSLAGTNKPYSLHLLASYRTHHAFGVDTIDHITQLLESML